MELGHADIGRDPLDHRTWKKLRKQFRTMIPMGPNHERFQHERHQYHDPECHGYGEEWAGARYRTFVRKGGAP